MNPATDRPPPRTMKVCAAMRGLPSDLARALRFIEERLEDAITLDEIAAAARARPRTVEKRFRAWLGTTPVSWLRRERLARARHSLSMAGPAATVTATALDSGFTQLGRFAVDYRRCFGETPSATLRRAREGRAAEEVVRGKSPTTHVFWASYRDVIGATVGDYAVVALGNTPELRDGLADLVLAGTKRATTALLRDFPSAHQPVPRVGDAVVLVDGRGNPRCVWRTTQVEIRPFATVDEAYARDEGEADQTRHGWLEMFRAYYGRRAICEGFTMDDRVQTVFERFDVVWPADAASRSR